MTTKLSFTRRPLEGIAHDREAERELQQLHKVFKRGDPVPTSIYRAADAILSDKAETMHFDTRHPIDKCQREVLRREPWLRFAWSPHMPDKYFTAIEFIEEAQTDDNA